MATIGTGDEGPVASQSSTLSTPIKLTRPPRNPQRPSPTSPCGQTPPAHRKGRNKPSLTTLPDDEEECDRGGREWMADESSAQGEGETRGNRREELEGSEWKERKKPYSRSRDGAQQKDLPSIPPTTEVAGSGKVFAAEAPSYRPSLLFPDDALHSSARSASVPPTSASSLDAAPPPSHLPNGRHHRTRSSPPSSPPLSTPPTPSSPRGARRSRTASLLGETGPPLPSRASSLGGNSTPPRRRTHSGSDAASSAPGSPTAEKDSLKASGPTPVRPRLAVLSGDSSPKSRSFSHAQRPRTAPNREPSRLGRVGLAGDDVAPSSPLRSRNSSRASTFITAPAASPPLATASSFRSIDPLHSSPSESAPHPSVIPSTAAAQPAASPPKKDPDLDPQAVRAAKRKRALRELVETEATYAQDLGVARDVYLAKAKGVAVQGWVMPPSPPFGSDDAAQGAGEGASTSMPPSPSPAGPGSVSPVVPSPAASSTFLPLKARAMRPGSSGSSEVVPTATSEPMIKRPSLTKALGGSGFRFPKRKAARPASRDGLSAIDVSVPAASSPLSISSFGASSLSVNDGGAAQDGLGIDGARAEGGGGAWAEKDRQVVYNNLEEVASLAEAFAALLDEAVPRDGESSASEEEEGKGQDKGKGRSKRGEKRDAVGACFLEMIPRLESVYMTYCSRYGASLARYEQLQPMLKPYLAACAVLARGRTTAWDLTSLLIKPVQRCLKYSLLLQNIIDYTDGDHPDYFNLQRAKTQMVAVADAINETKRRQELVEQIIGSTVKPDRKKPSSRGGTGSGDAASPSLGTSFGRFATRAGRAGVTPSRKVGRDELFDQLANRMVDSLSAVKAFRESVGQWSEAWRIAASARIDLVRRWKAVYAGHSKDFKGHADRLEAFMEQVAQPVADGLWVMLDGRIREEILPKCDQLISMYLNPLAVIAKRNSKIFDARHGPESDPATVEAAQAFDAINFQLIQELPRFLGASSTFFSAIVAKFAIIQRDAFSDERTVYKHWSSRRGIAVCDDTDVEALFLQRHAPTADKVQGFAITQTGELARKAKERRAILSMPDSPASADEFPAEASNAPWLRRDSAQSSGAASANESFTTVSERRRSDGSALSEHLHVIAPHGSRPLSLEGSPAASLSSTLTGPAAPPAGSTRAASPTFRPPDAPNRWSVGSGSRTSSVATSSPSFTFSQGQASSHRTTASSSAAEGLGSPTLPQAPSQRSGASSPALWQGVATAVVTAAKEEGRSFMAISPGELLDVWKEETVELADPSSAEGKMKEVSLCFGRKENGEMGWFPAGAVVKLA